MNSKFGIYFLLILRVKTNWTKLRPTAVVMLARVAGNYATAIMALGALVLVEPA